MSDGWLLCPNCGWSGNDDELDWDGTSVTCPACDAAMPVE